MKYIACGDLLFSSRNLAQRIDPRIVKDLQEADVVFGNAEFCTPNRGTSPAAGRGYITSVSPDHLDEFKALHINMVNFANNHTGDFGIEGILDTIHAAEQRELTVLGIGRNLSEARHAGFADTPGGRIAVVSASSTRSEIFAAADPGGDIAGRPGSNPLRWREIFTLPETEFKELKRIDDLLGTAAAREEGERIETFPSQGPNAFKFGSIFEKNLQIQKGEYAGVHTEVDEKDAEALLHRISDAAHRADFVVCAIHTHEGKNTNWYDERPADFIEDFARRSIDAGADAFIGHGAHFLRGVEIYKGHPIFYNIGSLFMEFEAGESKIAPEMYAAYGYGADALPSDLHRGRVKDKNGNFQGFASEPRFSQNVYVVFDIKKKGEFSYYLVPINLGLNRENPLRRGLPEIADKGEGNRIAERLTQISQVYGTDFVYDEIQGKILCQKNDKNHKL